MTFPKHFLWGSATAAHQVEGNNLNCDVWAEEYSAGSPYVDVSGDAVDHYRLYCEDIKLMAELGLKAYRFSIEWARIEPEPGHYSRSALEHYRDVLAACHEHGLVPMVTMHHFTSPRWLMRFGGWSNPETADRFARYCEVVFAELGELIPYTLTMNEVNLPVMLQELFTNFNFMPPVGIDASTWTAPQWREAAAAMCGTTIERYFTFHMASSELAINIIKDTHRKAKQVIKRISPHTKVGLSLALSHVTSVAGGEQRAAAKWKQYFEQYIDAIAEDDFLGVQNYTREVYGAAGAIPPAETVEVTQMGYEFAPESLGEVIRKVNQQLKIPIIVTEHGIATDQDERRVEFIQRGLKGVKACIADGIDVQGYLYWSAFDNFEWTFGYAKRFGIIAVNLQTQQRAVKESGRLLGRIAQCNGDNV